MIVKTRNRRPFSRLCRRLGVDFGQMTLKSGSDTRCSTSFETPCGPGPMPLMTNFRGLRILISISHEVTGTPMSFTGRKAPRQSRPLISISPTNRHPQTPRNSATAANPSPVREYQNIMSLQPARPLARSKPAGCVAAIPRHYVWPGRKRRAPRLTAKCTRHFQAPSGPCEEPGKVGGSTQEQKRGFSFQGDGSRTESVACDGWHIGPTEAWKPDPSQSLRSEKA